MGVMKNCEKTCHLGRDCSNNVKSHNVSNVKFQAAEKIEKHLKLLVFTDFPC